MSDFILFMFLRFITKSTCYSFNFFFFICKNFLPRFSLLLKILLNFSQLIFQLLGLLFSNFGHSFLKIDNFNFMLSFFIIKLIFQSLDIILQILFIFDQSLLYLIFIFQNRLNLLILLLKSHPYALNLVITFLTLIDKFLSKSINFFFSVWINFDSNL